jgi:Gpi18-like mannosyltransferase
VFPVVTLGLLLGALVLRSAALHFESPDFRIFISQWYLQLQQEGMAAFAKPFASYNPPYLYLLYLASLTGAPAIAAVKAISALGDLSLAIAVLAALRQLGRSRTVAVAGALTVLFVPTVLLNSAFWGQSDGLYTSILVWVLVLALRDSHAAAWLVFGVALAVKLQGIFFLPFLVILWLLRPKQRWWAPALALVPLVVAVVPAWLAGRPLGELAQIYSSQATSVPFLSYAPNLWSWFPTGNTVMLSRVALALTACACLAVVGFAVAYRSRLDDRRSLGLATLVLLVVPFLLPHMRERYFYPGEIFLVVFAFAVPAATWAALGVLTVSLLANLETLMHVALPWSYAQMSLVMAAALVWLMRRVSRAPAERETLRMPASAHEGAGGHEPSRRLGREHEMRASGDDGVPPPVSKAARRPVPQEPVGRLRFEGSSE